MSLIELLNNHALTSVFQPIVDTYRSSLIGYESLIRGPEGHPLERPLQLFAEAEALQLRQVLEQYCIRIAAKSFDMRQFAGALFINIDPNLLSCSNCLNELTNLPTTTAATVVLELSEHYEISDISQLKTQMHRLRAIGYRFAIDDLGAGHSSFKLWAEVRPDFVKLDRYFISDINNSPYKREFVQHIVTLAKNLHATVIAEGIETQEELRQLQKLGVFAMQGFLIGKPSRTPLPRHALTELFGAETGRERYDSLGSLLEDTTVVSSDRNVSDVLDYFQQNKRLIAIPVVDDQSVVGIIRRGQFMELMSTPFGRPLFAAKPARMVMQTNFLDIDVRAPLEQASALLTEHEDTIEQQILLIVDKDKYAGVIAVPSLLRRITELKIQNARYANPLTLLPGNVPINQTIDQHVSDGEAFSVMYFDLNYFKPFNDEYGYHRGDAVLQWFASLLEEYFPKSSHFVGHVGGDDFIVICRGQQNDLSTLKQLKRAFKEGIRSFYKAEHLNENGILGRARDGRYQRFPLLDFCVAILAVPPGATFSHQDIASAATKLKGKAKQANDGIALHPTLNYDQMFKIMPTVDASNRRMTRQNRACQCQSAQ
ncbi:bifunctional diguanylate cyclase/phosphodiesterase [Pseudidiomarina insulisalsae]|uniref:GGDEF domain-containing protein n=1 Tax=Pseudidiomarina insulisalsae TaxID=575789 RepID=A0A432YQ62_9GAMM|nr:EAL domain-containing protein [Pseudidiomarina insulisalsae]RUO63104.1 hypothetical protein CWI71_02460 [Pseudidiomarina insulisalsae]